ncbi:hypothetical protein GGI11_005456 [Coemansia sp. RSA 2049]|nr:hypothetical protein GGI11_005456 [Coemansia sp. RSA 2049]KAJ2610344.1 hypothetical protein EV177_004016 [Coemansia sp. RSA 1804]KAJ2693934.1 hypothetical protein GGH99_000925 [Coemansia sp. RSA 1285]
MNQLQQQLHKLQEGKKQGVFTRAHTRIPQAFRYCAITYLVSGVVALSLGSYYSSGTSDSVVVFTITRAAMRYYIFVGVYMLLVAGLGVFASFVPKKRRRLVNVYIGLVALVTFINLCVSLWLWTGTLNINDVYGDYWRHSWSGFVKTSLQEKLGCCGYLSPFDDPVMSSTTCQDSKTRFGCKYDVVFYAQRCHRYTYAGLIVIMLFGLAAMATGQLLVMECEQDVRILKSQFYHFRKRAESNANTSLADSDSPHLSLQSTNTPDHDHT